MTVDVSKFVYQPGELVTLPKEERRTPSSSMQSQVGADKLKAFVDESKKK